MRMNTAPSTTILQRTVFSHKYYRHLLRYYYLYLPLLAMLLLSIMYLMQYRQGQPLLLGPESYYHLTAFQSRAWAEYFPVGMIAYFIPEKALIVLPVLLTLGSLLLAMVLLSRLRLETEIKLLCFLLAVLTPAFLLSASTISTSLLALFLILAGLALLTNRSRSRYLSVIPLALVSFIDLFSGMVTLFLLLVYHFSSSSGKEKKFLTLLMQLLALLLLLNGLFLNESFVAGPFHGQQITADLVSDFGGISGIGFTVLLLSLLGMLLLWRHKQYRWLYLLLAGLMVAYIYSTQIIFYLALLLAFFAAFGFRTLFLKRWKQPTLKTFTILLIILSICFSAVSYLQRASLLGPAAEDIMALTWMKENIPAEKTIVALSEQGYYIRYFAQREPFYEPHQLEKKMLEDTLLNSTYIAITFPVLEKYNVGAVYVTPRWKERYPADRGGLLFLLKNERFKLKYSSEGYGVWVFE